MLTHRASLPKQFGTTNSGKAIPADQQGATHHPPAPGFRHIPAASYVCHLTRDGSRCNRPAPVIVAQRTRSGGTWSRRACVSCAAKFYNRVRERGV